MRVYSGNHEFFRHFVDDSTHKSLSEAGFLAFHKLSQPGTADVHQHLGIKSKYTAKFHSPTQYPQPPRSLSVVVLIMASDLSSDPRN